MSQPKRHALKARYIFPVDRPPIAGGVVTVDGSRIVAVGSVAEASDVRDLGNAAILPGLVNAHVHLEFSDLARPLGEPGMALADWIRLVFRYRAETGREPRTSRIRRGIAEALSHGTTTLGEIAMEGWDGLDLEDIPLDVVAFRELIGREDERAAAALSAARRHVDAAGLSASSTWHPALSPHAPYTVSERLLVQAARLAADRNVPLAIHLAESPEEIEWLAAGGGPMAELLAEAGDATPGQPPFEGPADVVRRLLGVPKLLVIHGNYLDEETVGLLAGHPDRMAVVYCPRTHAFFRHRDYPLAELLRRGVTVALGTDGRGSNPDLSLLAEMRHVAEHHPAVALDDVLRLGTLGGAVALGRDHEAGTLTPGKLADLAVVRLPDDDPRDPHEAVLRSDLPVESTIYRGKPLA